MLSSVSDFNEWLGKIPLPKTHKIVIAGNHECGFNDLSKAEIGAMLSNATYLQDESYEVAGRFPTGTLCLNLTIGIKLYGSPWTGSRHMGFSASREELAKRWAKIPKGIDVLVTHMPPRGIKDLAYSAGQR